MRFGPVSSWLVLGFATWAVPAKTQAQQPAPAPSTTQSQSGYPDVRKEAADPTLFPDSDKANSDAVRPRNGRDAGNAGVLGEVGKRAKRGGLGRANSQSLGQADTDPLPIRVAYRRAKTLALERDPGLGTLLKQADLAGSDVQKRRCLRAYYTQLFVEVRKIDPSPAMKSHLDALKVSTEQRYDPQRRGVADEQDLINGRLFGRPGAVH